MFGQLKQNIPMQTIVRMGRTTDKDLDGYFATVVGKSFSTAEFDEYILELEHAHPLRPGWSCITLTEACIEPLIPLS